MNRLQTTDLLPALYANYTLLPPPQVGETNLTSSRQTFAPARQAGRGLQTLVCELLAAKLSLRSDKPTGAKYMSTDNRCHPLASIHWQPFTGNHSLASIHWHPFTGNHSLASIHWQPFTGIHSLATIHWHPFTGNHSLATVHWQPFTGNHSLATIHWQPFTGNHSLATIH